MTDLAYERSKQRYQHLIQLELDSWKLCPSGDGMFCYIMKDDGTMKQGESYETHMSAAAILRDPRSAAKFFDDVEQARKEQG